VSNVTAIISLLHEGPVQHSAARTFRDEPVLDWTLHRTAMAARLSSMAILCWEDQLPRIAGLADAAGAYVLAKGPRLRVGEIESVAAARRWSDGWRGGLLGTCAFDIGFYAPWALELATKLESDAAVLIDPAAGLVDPVLIDALIGHAASHTDLEFCFAPTAPGLCGVLLRTTLLSRLASVKIHAGRLLHYMPDQTSRELIGSDACLNVPPPIARTLDRFTLDSDRQIARIEHATDCLNGELQSAGAEELVRRVGSAVWSDALPREVVMELNTRRRSKPIFWPGRTANFNRPDLAVDLARAIFRQIAHADDMRLTLAGVGDPMLSEHFFQILDAAHAAGIRAVHVETDLLAENPQELLRLARSPVDVVSVNLPALSEATYHEVMGIDGYRRALDNIRTFVGERQQLGCGVPLIVPIFTKCRQNLGEMEMWYDQWLRGLNCATIRGPSTFGGALPDVGVADMAPPGRRPCARLSSRMTIQSDGQIVSCEEDIRAAQPLGHAAKDSIDEVWRTRLAPLRADHLQGQWARHPLCTSCNEWHKP
jgi:hypothetical protein